MPQVPTLQNQVRLNPLPGASVRPLRSTVGESLGEGLSIAGETIARVREQEQQKADQAAFMDADRETDSLANGLVTRTQGLQLKDAIGSAPKALEEFDRGASKIELRLTSDRQKMAYRQAVNARRSQLQRQLDNHEGQQREAYYAKSREDYKAQAHANAVTAFDDPVRIESEIGKIRAVLDQTPGLDADMRAGELGRSRSAVYAGVVDRYLANSRTADAEGYYKAIKGRVDGPVASDIERAIHAAKQREEAARQARLTEVRQSLNDQIRDISAAAQAGIPVTAVPSKAVLQAAFGEREGAQRYDAAQTMANLSLEVSALHDLSASDLIQQSQQYRPTRVEGAAEQVQISQFMAGRVGQILKEREADPAGYLTQHSPAVTQAWDAFATNGDDDSRAAYLKAVRAERERLQIPGDDVLPNIYVQQVADRINTVDAQGLASLIETEAAHWGTDWPAVQGQLAGKISDTAAVISSGIARGAAVQLAATANLKQNELAALLPPGTEWSDVEAEVDQQLESFSASMPPEAASVVNAWRSQGARLAAQYMHQGMSLENAAKKVRTDIVRDQIVEFRAAPFRVPPEENRDQIEAGARLAVEQFSPASNLVIPNGSFTDEEYASQLQEYIRENGYWVTRPDAKGLRLYVDGRPVGARDDPVEYTWEQLRAFGDEAARAAYERRAAETRRRQEAR